ncbi:MAG TPA: S26 family signal peptidase [Candidatus Poseidoniales archaeon]|jgi:nickel-type superoxide dismutase maturation protease|nr:S26 family signal peptidase [Candidatus Poseidoniales archaeon]HIL00105.1 S26 family signal peptidase [Candidatus Poseidoniales archaeon]|tara:strand:- start:469 stop:774 length:306 start_codon:yes stop_codon:yes gene_type:complete
MDPRFLNVVVNGDSMWPTLANGASARFEMIDATVHDGLKVGQIVLLDHPFRSELRIIKRIQTISNGKAFLIGDNPDPTASEDSHNFGAIEIASIFAILSQN